MATSFFSRKPAAAASHSDHSSSGAMPASSLVNAYSSTFGSSPSAKAGNGGGPRTTVDDPVSMHLLMETAVHDSSEYAVLAPEEVDAMKRQSENLEARITTLHRNLAMQTKVRDAALSMGRLDAGDAAGSAEGQEAAAQCEQLGQELWQAEKEHMQLQRRLLEHTAGVLQMTHKGYTKDMSIASLTTGSSIPDDDFEDFDMNSGLYKPYTGDFEDGIIDIGGGAGGMTKEQRHMIENVENKVERLNGQLLEAVSRLDSRAPPPPQPRRLQDDPDKPVEILLEQSTALEQSMAAVQEVQARQLQQANSQLYQSITGDTTGAASPTYAAPPPDLDLAAQIMYLTGGMGKVRHLMNHMGQTVSSSGQKMENLEQYDSVLKGLWELLNTEQDDSSGKLSPRLSHAAGFSLAAFNTRVQQTHNRVSALEQQKDVLTRQIQQQRELNASSDSAKDARIAEMAEQTREVPRLKDSIAHMESEVVRLQTELTMSKAELDAAHGTRAQRKAEAAADPALTERVTTLERELSETIADYEAMTKATIDHEREREQLEVKLDQARDRIDALEVRLSEENIDSIGGGSKTPGTPATESSSRGTTTSAGVLKSEFKKMMKEAKADHARRLKEEQEERRRLEGIIRGLKKDQLGRAGGTGAAAGNKTPTAPNAQTAA